MKYLKGPGAKEDPDSLKKVNSFIRQGANVNQTDEEDNTALIYAASWHSREICEALLAGHADVNAANNRGWTSLMYAAQFGRDEILPILIAAAPKIDLKNDDGKTAIDVAIDGATRELLVAEKERQQAFLREAILEDTKGMALDHSVAAVKRFRLSIKSGQIS